MCDVRDVRVAHKSHFWTKFLNFDRISGEAGLIRRRGRKRGTREAGEPGTTVETK